MGIAPVALNAIHFEDWHIPFNLAAGITRADEGKAVTIDTTAANTVKLAGDGDPIFGRLEIVEDRVQEGMLIGTVALKFINKLPKTGAAITVGALIQGGGAGAVKALAPAAGVIGSHDVTVRVMEVGADYVIAIKQ